MEDQAELIKQQMQDKRAELSEKLGQLEQKVTGNLSSASNSVTETVQNVQESVQETVDSVKQAFDLSSHVREHPWVAVGGAVLVGYLAHEFLTHAPAAMAQSATSSSGGGSLSQLGQFAARTALQLVGNAVRQAMPPDVSSTIGQMFDQVTESLTPEQPRSSNASSNGKH